MDRADRQASSFQRPKSSQSVSLNPPSHIEKYRLSQLKSLPQLLLTENSIPVTFKEWQDSLRVESVITKSTHFVALTEYPRISPHRAAWVSFLSPHLTPSL